MVAAAHRHFSSLRRIRPDYDWIHHLLAEAENERMHLMTWIQIVRPTLLERFIIIITQFGFITAYTFLYIFSPKTAHRMIGYLEEEAITSYTEMLTHIDQGKIKNCSAPKIAIKYWNLPSNASLRDVTLAIRADEAMHRDTNHEFSDRLLSGCEDLKQDIK
jgi:ubiquinol oxidase